MDFAVKWAVESGFTEIDLGGDHLEHKKRWGPIKGSKTSLHLCPGHLVLMNRTKEIMNYVREKGIRQSTVTTIARIMALLHLSI